MTGFFARMGARANGTEMRLRIRTPEPYETDTRVGPPDTPITPAPPAPALSPRRSGTREPTAGTAPSGAAFRVGQSDAPPPGDTHTPHVHAKGRVAPPAARAAPRPGAGDVPSPPGPDAPQPEPPTAIRPQPTAPAEPPQPTVGRPTAADPAPAVAPPVPETVGPIDLPTLLKDHVLPALVARGVVARDETPALTEGPNPDAPDAPAPGTVTVRPVGVRLPPAEPVRSPPVGRARSAPGERARRAASSPSVHVHIGQVVVTRPPAVPPPPAPSPPGPSASTDHAAYLARREEGR